MAKAAGRKGPAPQVTCQFGEFMWVYFSREVIADRETLRRLAHRAIDLAVDSGRDDWLLECVAQSLAYIARDDVVKKVTDFVQEVWTDDS